VALASAAASMKISSRPAMQRRPAAPDGGDQLDQAAASHSRRQRHVRRERQIARRVARHVTHDQVSMAIPGCEVARQDGRAVDPYDVDKEQAQPDDGDEEPEPGGGRRAPAPTKVPTASLATG
jgi:hypothetical protein